MLTAADDGFHAGTTEDRSWTETCWFAASVPERGLAIWTYPLFRPELGIMSCGIYVWEPGAEELWQLPYYRTWWHLPIPPDAVLERLALPTGLRYERLEPLTAYRVTYEDDGIALDMTFRALHPPHAVGVEPGRHGHFDQLGRVTGELTLGDERIALDCVEMRDRTWSPRRESRQQAFVSYSYGATADGGAGFHLSTRHRPDRGVDQLLTGFLLDDGATTPLADGTCEVERDEQGRPVAVRLRGRTADGADLEADGVVLSRLSMPSTPWFVWACVVRWTLPGGRVAHGEHQDTWSPALLRASRESRR
jgi:hypothetical protein